MISNWFEIRKTEIVYTAFKYIEHFMAVLIRVIRFSCPSARRFVFNEISKPKVMKSHTHTNTHTGKSAASSHHIDTVLYCTALYCSSSIILLTYRIWFYSVTFKYTLAVLFTSTIQRIFFCVFQKCSNNNNLLSAWLILAFNLSLKYHFMVVDKI